MYSGTVTINIEDDDMLRKLLPAGSIKRRRVLGGGIALDVHVEIPDEALKSLDPYWGRFIWSLEHAQ